MFKRLLSVSGFTLLSRITGFIRDVLMAWFLGKGVLSDAFIVAFLFPNYFRAIFGEGTINPAFLPRYAALRAKGEHSAAERFGDHVFSWQMAAQLAILVLGLLFMRTPPSITPTRSTSESWRRSTSAPCRLKRDGTPMSSSLSRIGIVAAKRLTSRQ